MELVKGATVCITTDPAFENCCTANYIYVDYKNITKVVRVGSRVFIDDGLLSLIVEELGKNAKSFNKLLRCCLALFT